MVDVKWHATGCTTLITASLNIIHGYKMKFTLLLIALLFTHVSHAKAPAKPKEPISEEAMQGQIPKLSAAAFVLYDYSSSQFLLEQNSHQRIEPASLTKLMTAYITFSALKQNKITLNEQTTPSVQALRAKSAESNMYLDHTKNVTIVEHFPNISVPCDNEQSKPAKIWIGANGP